MAEQQKKMNVVQLTFIVTVNMMGSGIIMLPTNMAQVGAISLLSWLVTAIGSMAIAYGFAQAGVFNQRAGGMAAYAEDAYGKDGYFQVFFLYFISLAIANVAVAISALGYLSSFFPGLTATPIITCLGVIGLLWLTTVANFGGPKLTGKIGAVTVWGVILPVGFISIFGWFWFSKDTFVAAWNPNNLSLMEGMGSSISLTLWAFLGMESASQNASAVENPKRDVPLACLFGTLGAAAVYILSTTVIQGVVPNADLANSTGPFGLAFAQMFNPMIGQIVMALAVMACVGSLLGWQFTLASTAKDAAETQMFPGIFGKANNLGAPIAGMIIMGVVQTGMALMTISPNLSEQFGALVNLAVVTNVVPYIIALSAITVVMRNGGLTGGPVYTRNLTIAVIGIIYSVYALWASGMEAVMGGMLVMGLGWLVWTFMAPRFAGTHTAAPTSGQRPSPDGSLRLSPAMIAAGLLIFAAVAYPALAQDEPEPVADEAAAEAEPGAAAVPQTTLDRIGANGTLRLGYRSDARPFSYRDESGNPAGYSVALCGKVADSLESEAAGSDFTVEWVPVSAQGGLEAVADGRIDLLCGATTETLGRRGQVSFSIAVFPSGIGALLRSDAPDRLRLVLEGQRPPTEPLWRGQPAQVLQHRNFSAVAGTTAEAWLSERISTFRLLATVAPVDSYEAGVERVLDGESDVMFGDRAILLEAAQSSRAADELVVLDRLFTVEPIALALARGDEDFRLAVDRALSGLYNTPEFGELFTSFFGEPNERVLLFFRISALPE